MTKKQLTQLQKQLAAIEKTKTHIAKERDTLRCQINDLDDLFTSIYEAGELLEDGLRCIRDAVDKLSEQL